MNSNLLEDSGPNIQHRSKRSQKINGGCAITPIEKDDVKLKNSCEEVDHVIQ